MPAAHQQLRVKLYNTYTASTRTLVEDFSGQVTNTFRFSTALHGGFKDCTLFVPMSLDAAWRGLNKEAGVGWHFYHLEILEGSRKIWEGRLTDIELTWDVQGTGLTLYSLGYWSAMRDRYYDDDDAGNTDWSLGGPHNAGKVIKEMITNVCPAINGTVGVGTNARDITGITGLGTRDYPANHIVDRLAQLTDGTAWFFSVYDDRKPYWQARSIAQVDWYVWLQDIERGRLRQQGLHLRNYVLPVVGTTEGTGSLDAESTAVYPRREVMLQLAPGVPTAAANEARDFMLVERKTPKQDQEFIVSGRVYSTAAGPVGPMGGAMVELPKWRVRAGDVIRVQDLVPASASVPSFDDLRTFYIMETDYDAITDTLRIVPDRPLGRLSALLARKVLLERDR